jgi:hypothetical protein
VGPKIVLTKSYTKLTKKPDTHYTVDHGLPKTIYKARLQQQQQQQQKKTKKQAKS